MDRFIAVQEPTQAQIEADLKSNMDRFIAILTVKNSIEQFI